MSSIVKHESSMTALQMTEEELMTVLRSSLYVGAAEESIKLVLSYCKAAGLDPLQKPVHIVPMYASTGKKDAKGYDIKAMRDVIMPGIGLYRTQAARSGEYAGVTEPEFGDDVTEDLGGLKTTFPKWCRVTVKRLMANGVIVEFSAKEFWKENYATKGRDNSAPNAMWSKRPYGQIAKCAEAQALRKAFPEFGAQPTAEELEGKPYNVIDQTNGEITTGMSAESLADLIAIANKSKTVDEINDAWASGIAAIKITKDMGAYEAFKSAVAAKGKELKNPPIDAEFVDGFENAEQE